jgi:hypothetical protein
MADLKRSLKEAVRKLAYSTSVEQLKKRGVKKVSVLGLDRIVALIEEAVNRSLRDHLLTSEREAVVDATKEEFLRLLKSNEELRERQEQAEEEANNLRIELQRLRQELDQRMQEAKVEQLIDYSGQNAEILSQVQTLFTAGTEAGLSPAQMQEKVLELVMGYVRSEREEVEAAQAAARDKEIANLQRRINKLNLSLETSEQRLREVASRKDLDDGIASIYRDVQGLDDSGEDAGKKKELMAGIFAANLALQKKG